MGIPLPCIGPEYSEERNKSNLYYLKKSIEFQTNYYLKKGIKFQTNYN